MKNKTGNQQSTTAPRARELEEYAQATAYREVPSQQEMLNGGEEPKESPARKKKSPDPTVTQEIDEVLYEAAQQGNIGGG